MDDSVSCPEQKRESSAVELEPPAKKVRFTRGCPACESGMNAPGIHHSASCKSAFEASSSPSVGPDGQDPGDAAMEGSTEGLAVDTEFAQSLRRRLRMRLSDPSRGFHHCCRMLQIWHSRRQTLVSG